MFTSKDKLASAFPIAVCILFSVLPLCATADAQILNQDQEIQLHNLPFLTARSKDAGDVLLTALETVVNDREICCSRDSALHDSALRADPTSLKDVSLKLQGRQLLSDGRSVKVTADCVSSDSLNAGRLIASIQSQQAALIKWHSHVYVLHGVVYRWIASGNIESYSPTTVIHKLLLWDIRFSDARRDVVFDRTTDDLSKVEGGLFLQATPE